MNLRDRRAAQAKAHADEVAGLQARLAALTSAEPYQAGFQDGVVVAVGQLAAWLIACQQKAQGIIADLGELHCPDWKRGHDFAAEWIGEAIENLGTEVARRAMEEGRAHAVATGHQEDA